MPNCIFCDSEELLIFCSYNHFGIFDIIHLDIIFHCDLIYRVVENMKQYIVDAFTSEPFSGNPAAVCVMERWPSDESMMKLARENNLSETAFIVK